jgi:RNA-binding protein NOB1
VTIDSNGNIAHIYNSWKKVSLRGTKFPIPLPKGGRQNNDLILTEDQWIMESKKRVPSRKKDVITNVFDPDYLFSSASNSAEQRHSNLKIGYGKKNPNVSRKKIGKRNKNKMGV